MGTTYTVSAKVKCWKRHECVDCGCEYRYLFQRTIQGQGGTEQAAQQSADRNVENAIKNDVDVRPCPGCGRVQPDMIGQVKAGRHSVTTWLSFLAAIIVIVLGATHVFPYSTAGLILGALTLATVAIQLAIAIPNPNANLDANQAAMQRFLNDGTLEILEPGRIDDLPIPPSPMKTPHWIGILAGLLAAAVALAPLLAKTLKSWPSNADFVPEVVGPGDEFTVWFPTSIQASKGYWNGTPTVTVVNANEVGVNSLIAKGRNSTWGNRISGKSVSNQTTHPFGTITIPNDPKLLGKSIRLRMTMNVTYPFRSGTGFENHSTTLTHETSVVLASVQAGSTYTTLFWSGCVVGSLLAAASGFYLKSLANALRAQAIPTVVDPITDKTEPTNDEA